MGRHKACPYTFLALCPLASVFCLPSSDLCPLELCGSVVLRLCLLSSLLLTAYSLHLLTENNLHTPVGSPSFPGFVAFDGVFRPFTVGGDPGRCNPLAN